MGQEALQRLRCVRGAWPTFWPETIMGYGLSPVQRCPAPGWDAVEVLARPAVGKRAARGKAVLVLNPSLPLDLAVPLALVLREGCTYREAAARLGRPPAEVATALRRALLLARDQAPAVGRGLTLSP